METKSTGQLPYSLDRVEIRAVGREEVQAEVFRVALAQPNIGSRRVEKSREKMALSERSGAQFGRVLPSSHDVGGLFNGKTEAQGEGRHCFGVRKPAFRIHLS